ncbi:MAG: thiamine pyrophosphokinase [Thermobacillus sp. ZCTH02-B1]|uniref:thiamine diphosphokinase n=1 Tax=Thermobacillus sp. ZCTH02-B1 TaxID=1858795 RepID=UPI000B554536|nr:thiamine diphosphokinase [Thermobacillus sp. ZCTH02-B1]OUM96674.1 MAG: thiamine pyrophosphokinase [Thermobacillus sp. ZCTH02-B1]
MTDTRRVVIFSGGYLGDDPARLVRPGDVLIGADSGALRLIELGLEPDLAIGDFDSVSPEELELIRRASRRTEIVDPVDKDYTDTELAFRRALEFEPDEIVIAGALGTRFDHSLANVHLLAAARRRGVRAAVLDGRNEIRLAAGGDRLTFRRTDRPTVSLLPLTPVVTGITLEGFRYPLTNARLEIGQSLGISNVLEASEGAVTVGDGMLLVMFSRD